MKSAIIATITTLLIVVFSAFSGNPVPSWAAVQLYFIVLIADKICNQGKN